MPVLSLDGHHDVGEEAGRDQLLALCAVQRSLERGASQGAAYGRKRMALMPTQLARELRELIAALDRRTPRVERVGEASIARDAAALREKAVRRLAELDAEEPVVNRGRR